MLRVSADRAGESFAPEVDRGRFGPEQQGAKEQRQRIRADSPESGHCRTGRWSHRHNSERLRRHQGSSPGNGERRLGPIHREPGVAGQGIEVLTRGQSRPGATGHPREVVPTRGGTRTTWRVEGAHGRGASKDGGSCLLFPDRLMSPQGLKAGNQPLINRVAGECSAVPDDQQLAAGTCQGHVQTPHIGQEPHLAFGV